MSIPYARNETFTSSANIIRAVNCTFTGENSHITVQKANNCIFDHCASVDVKKVYGRDSIIKSTVGEKETTITVDRPTTWVGEGK